MKTYMMDIDSYFKMVFNWIISTTPHLKVTEYIPNM